MAAGLQLRGRMEKLRPSLMVCALLLPSLALADGAAKPGFVARIKQSWGAKKEVNNLRRADPDLNGEYKRFYKESLERQGSLGSNALITLGLLGDTMGYHNAAGLALLGLGMKVREFMTARKDARIETLVRAQEWHQQLTPGTSAYLGRKLDARLTQERSARERALRQIAESRKTVLASQRNIQQLEVAKARNFVDQVELQAAK